MMRYTKELVEKFVSGDPYPRILQRRVGRSVITSAVPSTSIFEFLGRLVIQVTPAPVEFLLKRKVARSFIIGLRGSDLSASKYNISLCSPEIELHGNFLLVLASLFRTTIRIHIYARNPTVTRKGLSTSLTSALYSRDLTMRAVGDTQGHRKYSEEYLSFYDSDSFVGHWLGDKYCRHNLAKNFLDVGYCIAPSREKYISSFVHRFRTVIGGDRDDFRRDVFRQQLLLRGEARIRLLNIIYKFYKNLHPFRTEAVTKVFAFLGRTTRRKHPGINVFKPPQWLLDTVENIITKKYGRDNVIELVLWKHSPAYLSRIVATLEASGFNAYRHGSRVRLYDRSLIPLLIGASRLKSTEALPNSLRVRSNRSGHP